MRSHDSGSNMNTSHYDHCQHHHKPFGMDDIQVERKPNGEIVLRHEGRLLAVRPTHKDEWTFMNAPTFTALEVAAIAFVMLRETGR